jgi:hypothetical protein
MLTRAVDLKSAAAEDLDISAPFNELVCRPRMPIGSVPMLNVTEIAVELVGE